MAVKIKSGDILTEEQLLNHFVVYAGPGAGKTHFLVENVKNIVKTNRLITKSKQRKVLCITYTNAAVNEIKHRLDSFSDAVDVNTIHGFIIDSIIKPFQSDLRRIIKKDFDITISTKSNISSQIEGLSVLHGCDKEEIYAFIKKTTGSDEDITYGKKVMGEIEVDVKKFCEEEISDFKAGKKIDKKYIVPIKSFTWNWAKKMTHDEILYFGYRILQENPTALYALRVKYPFVFVDEFQDTSPLQTLIIQLIGEKSTVVGVIGDIAQSIYSFQGARPQQFVRFSIQGNRPLLSYKIEDNRRSTDNIVNFCNYLRQSDSLTQTSIKTEPQSDNIDRPQPVKFIVGNSTMAINKINEIIASGGVVLTRTWVAAFDYIQDIKAEQAVALKKIHNSYFNTSVDLRADIVTHNNVTWVRAFRFILKLFEAYESGSLIDVISAFSLYIKMTKELLTKYFTSSQIIKIKNMLELVFANTNSYSTVVSTLTLFNQTLKNDDYTIMKQILQEGGMTEIQWLTEYDEKIEQPLSLLTWDTATKLFNDVFSEDSAYMTVHQAKGLEWNKVIVGVNPTKKDGTSLIDLFNNPKIAAETPAEEFVRIFYVACSRAKEELYVHIPEDAQLIPIIKSQLDLFKTQRKVCLDYEFIH